VKPFLAILGYFDLAVPLKVVLVSEVTDGEATVQYIAAGKGKPFEKPFTYPEDRLHRLTTFGITPEYNTGRLLCHQRGESTATYDDGKPRRWQGKPQATALVRKELRSQAKEACEVAP